MSTLDDITADVSSKITTQTTGDNTSTRVRTALINLASQILDDVAAQNTTITTGIASATAAATVSAKAAAAAHSSAINLIDARYGQKSPGLATPSSGDLPSIFNAGAMVGGTLDAKLNFGGGIDSPSVGWNVSDYFAVLGGGTISAVNLDSVGICFYDINRAFVSQVSGLSDHAAVQVITIPSNAVFGRVSVETFGDANTTVQSLQVLPGDWSSAGTPHVWQTMIARPSMFRPWMGRNWSMHGDGWWSTDAGQDWFVRAAQYHGVKKAKQEAHGGGRAATLLNGADGSTPLPLSFWDDVHACFVFSGLKDATDPSGIPSGVGAITDATTATTFYGYYRKFIETVLTRNPFMRMILAVPHHVDGFATSVTNPYITAVRTLGDFYSLKLLDFKAEGQWSPFSFPFYAKGAGGGGSVDTIHPGYHTGSINTLNPPLKSDLGEDLVYGGPLKGLMHIVFPVDHLGDPTTLDPATATFV